MDPTWQTLHHRDLTGRQMHDLLRLRHRVFVREQDCPDYDDIDGLDVADDAHHVLAYDGDVLLATARVLPPRDAAGHSRPREYGSGGGAARVGRVVVAPEGRGRGLAHELVRRCVEVAERTWPGSPITLGAQAHLTDLYAAYGFVPVGEPYVEDGIPHVDMTRPPA
ncbi:GNAT family N-acetyltransferase [Nocardioides donggukensis]|uniref:GNAT family N-acetyltransferase n=1 Tax=Nocardioides donggukensis TaxID=2774019 RepID=A0A927K5W5_9ACTN|nr:GNAT family N-acetyltransferase [Nocardioides donggukensis]MBD8870814.1 GNAT family N-acetyltransferase [Nocardioides donggukensis]